MKKLGIVRKLDDLGRIVIPMEVRRTHNWEKNAPMEMFISEQGLVIRKFQDQSDELHEVVGQLKAALDGGILGRDSIQKAIDLLKQK
jgi:bifunctional DNA-binding transcriptional regulator/antitoxin component of YhaV-PrlF toxin-antitoxin module